MTATLTVEKPATTGNDTTGRRLHAFPPGSRVSLCGRVRPEHPPAASGAARHCDECMAAARGTNPMGR